MGQKNYFDVIVIGSGLGGEGVVMGLIKGGKNVVIIEKESSVGGGCIYWGIILLKVLCYVVSCIIEFNSNLLFCKNNFSIYVMFLIILSYVKSVIDK